MIETRRLKNVIKYSYIAILHLQLTPSYHKLVFYESPFNKRIPFRLFNCGNEPSLQEILLLMSSDQIKPLLM